MLCGEDRRESITKYSKTSSGVTGRRVFQSVFHLLIRSHSFPSSRPEKLKLPTKEK